MNALDQHTLTAFFRDRSDAEKATRELMSAGIAEGNIRLVPGKEPDSVAATDIDGDRKGFWEALGDFFFPDDDREVYAEGLRRGGYLVTVSNVTEAQHQQAIDILDDDGTIDVDAWSDSWRADGWAPANPAFDRDRTPTPPAAQAISESERALAAERELREEDRIIGRRDSEAGGARVRAYTHERPEDFVRTPPGV
jgi:hypothetical protein